LDLGQVLLMGLAKAAALVEVMGNLMAVSAQDQGMVDVDIITASAKINPTWLVGRSVGSIVGSGVGSGVG
jgi:hypothetical protein